MVTLPQDISQLIASGDQQAFRLLYQKYYSPLCFYALRYVQDKDDAEEIVQSVMAKLFETRENHASIKNINAYLYRMVYNSCVNFIEKMKVRDRYKTETEAELAEIALEDESPIDDDMKMQIAQAIRSLPEQSQKVFKMKYLHGLRYKEIAEELGIGERTVETHLKRAILSLREKLTDKLLFVTVIICAIALRDFLIETVNIL